MLVYVCSSLPLYFFPLLFCPTLHPAHTPAITPTYFQPLGIEQWGGRKKEGGGEAGGCGDVEGGGGGVERERRGKKRLSIDLVLERKQADLTRWLPGSLSLSHPLSYSIYSFPFFSLFSLFFLYCWSISNNITIIIIILPLPHHCCCCWWWSSLLWRLCWIRQSQGRGNGTHQPEIALQPAYPVKKKKKKAWL